MFVCMDVHMNIGTCAHCVLACFKSFSGYQNTEGFVILGKC